MMRHDIACLWSIAGFGSAVTIRFETLENVQMAALVLCTGS
jgi:hypothetical protein